MRRYNMLTDNQKAGFNQLKLELQPQTEGHHE
jgi:hypothetical protein